MPHHAVNSMKYDKQFTIAKAKTKTKSTVLEYKLMKEEQE